MSLIFVWLLLSYQSSFIIASIICNHPVYVSNIYTFSKNVVFNATLDFPFILDRQFFSVRLFKM
jgi:hypothetical protein